MRNKQIVHYITRLVMLVALLFNSGCVKLEDDLQGEITPETFFATQSDLEAAVISSFRPLSSAFGLNERAPYYWSGDDISTTFGGNKGNYGEYDVFNPQNTNPYISSTWNGFFRSVLTANNVLNNYEKVPNLSEEVKNQLAGQSAFIRGVSYFEITRTFGRVPLLTTLEVTGKEEKAEFSALYDQIIADLIFARDNLPEAWPGEPGRPTKWSAQAVLANVYLSTTGFPMKIAANAAKAATEAKNVIDNGPFVLQTNFSDLWLGEASNNNKESIFSFQFCGSCGGWGYGNFKSWQGYDWGDFFAELAFYNNFPAGARKGATFITEYPDPTDDAKTLPFNVVDHKHPEYKKFGTYNPDGSQEVNSYDQNIYYLRYAELLLIYAEAQVRATGDETNADALSALNKVKKRAWGNDADFVPAASASAEDVVWERAWEMAGEFSRWHDLVRTEQLEEVFATRAPSEPALRGTINEAKPWALIPAQELELNPNLRDTD